MDDRLPQIRPNECVRALERLGFIVRRQTGSHVILRHPASKRIVSVPHHTQELKRGLLFGIIKQADVGRQAFLDALR